MPFSSLEGLSWNLVGNATTSGTSVICTVVPFLCSRQADGSFAFGAKKKDEVNIAQVAKALSTEGEWCKGSVKV